MNWQEARDQAAHTLIALAIVVLAASGSVILCGVAGFAAGMLWEVRKEGPPIGIAKILAAMQRSKRDLSFWMIGGAIGGVLT